MPFLFMFTMKLVYVFKHWDKEEVSKDSETLYIYGDDIRGISRKGQACIRGLPNTYGLITRRDSRITLNSYFNDRDIIAYSKYLERAFKEIQKLSDLYKTVVISPVIVTGLSHLDKKAPKCFKALREKISKYV